jgi:GNAT superfamily N-acetyltransferase
VSVAIRAAHSGDVTDIVGMVHELARYEHAAGECRLTDDQLRAALFAADPSLFGHVAVDASGASVGFALWFLNFSTWRGAHGIYLEDLYVRPSARGQGVGRALLAELATVCAARGYERLDWWVLHWNPAREFYQAIGAQSLTDWVPYRLEGSALTALASGSPSAGRTP